jgi:RND family efflux transporter MFP subunit
LLLWGRQDKSYRAKLRELSPSADPATRTFAARFSIPEADGALSLGMTATLTISGHEASRVASVPLSSLYNQGQGPALWKVESDGRLSLTPVEVLRYEANAALVSGGVEEGDTIVTLGVQKLDAGQKVRVLARDSF